MSNPLVLGYTTTEIELKRAEVARRFMTVSPNVRTSSITRIAGTDIRLLFNLYDEIFLNHYFAREFPGNFRFSLSTRLTRSAGKTICPRDIGKLKPEETNLEIRMGTQFFFQFDAVPESKSVGGIIARHSLEAFQLVLEHEICHALEFILFHHSNCSGKRFRTLARNLFGHTESYHRLPTQQRIATAKYGFKIGDPVSFPFKDQQLQGLLYRLHKRAVVMVRDRKGSYVDKQGNRYSKYTVPLGLLKTEGMK